MTTVTSNSSVFDTINTANSSSKSSAASANTAEDIQSRFLTLLVTQLKNQDPLNPMDNSQVTTQLAQISTVSGIDNLNTTVTSMLDAYNGGQAMQAAGLVGKNVMVAGEQLALSSSKAYGGVSLSSAADQVTLSILDSSGKVIQTESLGAKAAGNFGFAWDGATSAGGTATDGTYTFKVEATQGGQSVTATALQVGTVSAVTRTGSGFKLDLGALGAVDFSAVQEIL
jgi:flagellar basal-body rod modification protein FlgD